MSQPNLDHTLINNRKKKMIKINLKRSATNWRVALLLLGFLGSTNYVSSAPVDSEESKESSSFLSSPRRSLEQGIGSPSDLAWQAWLLLDNQPGSNSGLDSASILRRITPKSVFIAPQLQACADGYKADNMGRCQKIVNIDQEAHLRFLLERLKKLYGKDTSPDINNSNEKKKSTVVSGPFQLNIPLLPDSNRDQSNSQIEEDDTPQSAILLETKKNDSFDYITRNRTKVISENNNEDSNSSIYNEDNKGSSSISFVVPIPEFIHEENDTFSDKVEYNIPSGLEININHTLDNGKQEYGIVLKKDEKSTTDSSWSQEENSTKDDFLIKDDDLTTLSSKDEVIEDEVSHESTIVTRVDNMTVNQTLKEITSDGIVDIDSKMETWRNESDTSSIQGIKKNDTIEPDVIYDEESEPDLEDQDEYSDTTQVTEDDSVESEDEILKHGETGMMIPIENQVLIRSEKKKIHIPNDNYQMETTTFFDNDSDSIMTTEVDEDLGSNVSTEVNINKDFVLETTLLDVNTGKVKNSTKPVSANSTANQQNRDDDLKALFEAEKKLITEPEVVFSPQDNRGSSIYGRKRDGQLLETNFQSIKESYNLTTIEPFVTSKPLPHPAHLREYPIEEENFHSERILPSNKNKFSYQSHNIDTKPLNFGSFTNFGRPIPVNNQRNDFVRFPNYERLHQGYVRFPSDDINSIHNQEFKEKFQYSRNDHPNSATSTKSSISFNQKQSNWWIPPPPRMDRKQTFIPSQISSNQSPMLLRFWERMPLLRDPSLDSRFSTSITEKEFTSRSPKISPSRRINFYDNTSQHQKRIISPNIQTSIEE